MFGIQRQVGSLDGFGQAVHGAPVETHHLGGPIEHVPVTPIEVDP
jgi:hypothetical protein